MTMTEDQFLKTMIETIKYDDYEKKEEMLTILILPQLSVSFTLRIH